MSGRGRGRGSRGGRTGSVSTVPSDATERQRADRTNSAELEQAGGDEPECAEAQDDAPEVHQCGMCGHNVGNDAIGCDKCTNWVHPSEMCSGLPTEVIKSIQSVRGNAILFVCTNCRVKPPSSGISTRHSGTNAGTGGSDQLIQQLFLSVKGICAAVMELTVRLDKALSGTQIPPATAAQSHPDPSHGKNHPAPPNSGNPDQANPAPTDDYRTVIRQEMREMQERAKRRQSVIIKGLQAQSARQLAEKFGDLSHSFTGTRVELSEVVPITNHSDLFRAKILNDDHRRLVLDRAKTLRETEHANVFIRRDLTFAQRKELRERRAQRSGEGLAGTHGETSSIPVELN